ncbi:MAG: prolyl aminopeptidase [Kiloniellales bacterium]
MISRAALYPSLEPFRTDYLKVSDLHSIYYEEAGRPDGRPAVFLHGGPGVGILPGYRRFFDPEHYRTVLFDQRGAGRSKPHAEIRENDTWALVEDLEKLRRHLGIERWVVMGGSWGSTLALCYAIAYPESVKGLIVRGIFLGRPWEVAWLHEDGGAAKLFPDEYERFRAQVSHVPPRDTVAAYYEQLTGGDQATRLAAAKAWSRWETSMATLVTDAAALEATQRDTNALSKARLECHFTHHRFFMKSDNFILENAGRIAETPCRIVQGRHDPICPTLSAWELHKALPKSDLRIVPDGSHSPMDPGMAAEMVQGAEDFKEL